VTRRRVLAISGKRFASKDTFAAALCRAARERGVELASYAFAAQCKRMFAAAARTRGEDVDLARLAADRDYKERWRPQLTAFTVAALAADPLVFVRDVARDLEADPRPALITDLRLRLEHDELRARYDLQVLRITRADAARAASGWRYDATKDLHFTETDLDDPTRWSELITNDGTEAELGPVAARVVSEFLA
jgi:phosphomevalonate kinase